MQFVELPKLLAREVHLGKVDIEVLYQGNFTDDILAGAEKELKRLREEEDYANESR